MNPTVPEHLQLSKSRKLNVSKSRTSLSFPQTCASSTSFHRQIAAPSTLISSPILKILPLDFTLLYPHKWWVTNLCCFHLSNSPYIIPAFSTMLPVSYCNLLAISHWYDCSALLANLSSSGPAPQAPSTLLQWFFQEITPTLLLLCLLLLIE